MVSALSFPLRSSAGPSPRVFRSTFLGGLLVLSALTSSVSAQAGGSAKDALDGWSQGVQIKPALPAIARHTIHAYQNTCPESPDGKSILFYTSTTPEAHEGEIRVLDRATGKERVLAKNVHAEDAHRVAVQQWISNGKRMVFQDERDGEWIAASVDLASGKETVLARNRWIGFTQPKSDLLPIYGVPYNPGGHCDLETVDVATGETRTLLTAQAVAEANPGWVQKKFGEKPLTIFFPIMSPDCNRFIFKLSTVGTGKARSGKGFLREGLFCYDQAQKRQLPMFNAWGHPAWGADSKTIVDLDNAFLDTDLGQKRALQGPPKFHGHPTASPDGKLFVTDTTMENFGGSRTEWGIFVFNEEGYHLLYRFDNSHGARSWRASHPHPVFSPDGKRIYFNVSSDEWTRIYVAEMERTPGGDPR